MRINDLHFSFYLHLSCLYFIIKDKLDVFLVLRDVSKHEIAEIASVSLERVSRLRFNFSFIHYAW